MRRQGRSDKPGFEDVPEARRAIMRAVKGKNTAPELLVRSLLHRLGYRFRLHRRDLPGRPDIVLPGRATVILVHGCFWHRHSGCRLATTPRTRREFWAEKFEANMRRDAGNRRELKQLGWRVLVVWECETRRPESLSARLDRRLRAAGVGSRRRS